MPRRKWNDGQEINFADFDAIGACIERELYDRFVKPVCENTVDAFFGDSFLAVYTSSTSVTVTAGLGFQEDTDQVSPEPTMRPIYIPEAVVRSITSPDSSNPRWDILCVKSARVTELTGTRRYKDPSTEAISDETMDLQTDWEADFTVVAGTPAGSPVKPSVPAGYIKIAELYVNAGTGLSGAGDVYDTREIMPTGSTSTMSTLGFDRLTAASSRTLAAIITEIDAELDEDAARLDHLTAVSTLATAGSGNLNAADFSVFRKTGSASATNIGLQSMAEGQTITVCIETVASQAAITWKRGTHDGGTADIKWSGGVVPTPTTTASRLDRYVFQMVNSVIYGSADMNCY